MGIKGTFDSLLLMGFKDPGQASKRDGQGWTGLLGLHGLHGVYRPGLAPPPPVVERLH